MLKRSFFLTVLGLVATSAAASEFILSYWCGPPEKEPDLKKRYAEVAECGFNYAMLPCSGATIAGNKAILDACQEAGLKYILIDSRILHLAPENPSFTTNLNAVIDDYRDHPALGGYLLGDEPSPDGFRALAAVNQYLLARDPERLPFVNLYPNYAPEWALGGTYESYVERFVTTVKPRLLSFDHYALMTDGSLRPIYFQNLEIIRRQGLKHKLPTAFIFQLTPHFAYRNPTEAELRWQANTGLIYGVKALFYFTYWTPTSDPAFKKTVAIIAPDGRRSPHFEAARRVNAAIRAWAPTLLKLTSLEVFHTGELPLGTTALPAEAPVQVEGEGTFILGTFQHEDGSFWCMIMNRDMQKEAVARLRFKDSFSSIRELSSETGKLRRLRVQARKMELALPAGGARLFQLPR